MHPSVDAAEPDELGMSQMKAIHADQSGTCADSVHNGGDRRLARTRRSGDAEDGPAALSEQPSGEFGQAVHRRFHAEILSPRSFESLE